MGGSDSDSGSGSDSGRSNRSQKKDKSHKKDKKDKKDKKYDSGDEPEKKDKKDKKDNKDDKDKKDKKDDKDKKDKKDDKDKKDKKDDKHKDEHKNKPTSQLPAQLAQVLSGTSVGGLAQEFLQGGGHGLLREGPGADAGPGAAPTIPSNPSTGPGTGASGQRVPCTTTDPFPAQAAGPAPPFVDSTGQPAYVGSALISGVNVQPCRVTASGGCFVASNGAEVQHSGRYDLLPLTDAMEWVPASGGAPPVGKRVVEGGIEDGSSLYHACARVNSVMLPGKAGSALGGAQIPAGGAAHSFTQGYFVLCWRE